MRQKCVLASFVVYGARPCKRKFSISSCAASRELNGFLGSLTHACYNAAATHTSTMSYLSGIERMSVSLTYHNHSTLSVIQFLLFSLFDIRTATFILLFEIFPTRANIALEEKCMHS